MPRVASGFLRRETGTPGMSLADGDDGNLLPDMVPPHPFGARIQYRFSVDHEPVMMLAVVERDLGQPRAVRLPFHRVGHRIPIIEVAHDVDLTGFRGETNKPGGVSRFPGRITIAWRQRSRAHKNCWNITAFGKFSTGCS